MLEAEYVSKAKAKILTMQIADALSNRRPSHVELYGHEEKGSLSKAGKTGSRIQSASSTATVYDPPPPVALPNKTMAGDSLGSETPPVTLLRETSVDDRLAITNAAERKKLVRRALLRAHEQEEDSPQPEDTYALSQDSNFTSDKETVQLNIPNLERAVTDPTDQLVSELTHTENQVNPENNVTLSDLNCLSKHSGSSHALRDQNSLEFPQMPFDSDNSGSMPVTVNVDQEEVENDSAEIRRSVLSAANDRRKSISFQQEEEEEDDAIEVIPH
ncbi:hypothetical protein ElyMa_000349400 [Elysia marginata]|uniref:Uncharacterized protein n=1 Tax=Elysia marginata TaxID=1093978 RepID=A0AAV4FDF3_9GAST|nr:hypothetical protein ElyMa_000349400 [Elysia marginata]